MELSVSNHPGLNKHCILLPALKNSLFWSSLYTVNPRTCIVWRCILSTVLSYFVRLPSQIPGYAYGLTNIFFWPTLSKNLVAPLTDSCALQC